MKITRVTTAVVAGNFPWVLVRVETDEGVTGLGEAYWGVGVAELVHKAAPVIVGQNPFDINRLYEMMIRCLSGEGSQGGATITAISGIEIALWDLMGKALGVPISEVFDTMQAYFGNLYINDFIKFGRVYRVQTEA